MKKYQEPERILYINGGTMDFGGISSYMMNYYRNIDREKLQIDFAVHGKKDRYDDEILSLGGKIYYLPTKKEDFKGWKNALIKIFKSGEYKIVHAHADTMNGYILKLAAQCKIPVRISHSHNTAHLTNNKLKILVHDIIKTQIYKYATHLWACSEAAGKWLYKNRPFDVIPNAVNLEKYSFNEELRKEVREELGLKDEFTIGHIGKFEYQKNHEFLTDVFSEVVKLKDDSRLVLVGDGSERENIEKKAEKLGIKDKILFLGKRTDAERLYNAFDVFVMPSRFEGLPVTLVEAQANGLSQILSDCITKEVDITGVSTFISLNKSPSYWAEKIVSEKRKIPKKQAEESVINAGYSIKDEADKLLERYIKSGE